MMGTPGSYDDKGLIPRSLEQIFEARQKLKEQGWKYEMQVCNQILKFSQTFYSFYLYHIINNIIFVGFYVGDIQRDNTGFVIFK